MSAATRADVHRQRAMQGIVLIPWPLALFAGIIEQQDGRGVPLLDGKAAAIGSYADQS